MPWDARSFASKHNKKLIAKPGKAASAARQANAMLKAGVPEGVAIATANKRASKPMVKAAPKAKAPMVKVPMAKPKPKPKGKGKRPGIINSAAL